MKYLVTNTLNSKERKKYEDMGLFCYDLRDSDFGNDIASIEKEVCVNNIGSIITNKKLKLGNTPMVNDFIDYKDFVSHNKAVNSIKGLLKKYKDKEVR